MMDDRLAGYADVLVDQCLAVQPGWEVLVLGQHRGRPLYDELGRALARRGAHAVFQLSNDGGIGALGHAWLREAPAELIARPSRLQTQLLADCDALVMVTAPDNTRDGSAVEAGRLRAGRGSYQPAMRRFDLDETPWVTCSFPTPALAQDAGMSTGEFADFLFGACLLDWNAERERMLRYADRFDAAAEVRIVGDRTDLRLGIDGRRMEVDAGGTGGGANMPGGEFYCSPIEDSAEGDIVFAEFPVVYRGRELTGVRLRFEGGRVTEASADINEDFLLETLDSDEGARRLGELGIGCNPGISRHTKNVCFDEKIDGTVHVALGFGFPQLGGTNESVVHWDIVKDLRGGGRIELDGEVVQEGGRWLI